VTTFTYTNRGQQDIQTKGNGNTVDDDYYLDGSLQHQVEKKPNGTIVSEHTYSYDPNGNKTQDVAKKMNADNHAAYLNTTTNWTYDPLDRIAQVTKTGDAASTETYVHDPNNNVVSQTVKGTTTTFNYDRNRLLTSASGGSTANYNYDPYGRLDTVTSAGKVIERNTYDGFDHIAQHEEQNSGGALVATKYTYDPLDRTTSKTTDPGGANEKTTDYNYLGLSDQVLNEDVAGKITKSYQYSPWGERLSQVKFNADGSKEDAYYGYNDHTDVEDITDSNGDTKATYGYTAYGQNDDAETTGIDKPDPTDPTKEPYNAYRYEAQRWDANSGTYDMGFRDYNPGLNRFLTRDTYNGALDDVGLATDSITGNRYAFSGGNPVGSVELDGHDPHGCRPTDDAASRACHERAEQIYYAEQGLQKLTNPHLGNPPPGMRPENIQSAGIFVYGSGLSIIAGYLQSLRQFQRGNQAIILSRVTVETENGPASRVVAFTSQAGLPKGLRDQLAKAGITVYTAPAAPKGSKEGHAERAAADLRGDVARQVRDLGGPITSVESFYSTIQICTEICKNNANKFIDDPSKSVEEGTNGMIGNKTVNGGLLRNIRSGLGLTGEGYTATWAVARGYWMGLFGGPGGEEGEGGEGGEGGR
jgi:RHS repeat-associated protein